MARIGVVSDIHGNANAFMAVLNQLGRLGVDELYCLGDIVGYVCFYLIDIIQGHALAV